MARPGYDLAELCAYFALRITALCSCVHINVLILYLACALYNNIIMYLHVCTPIFTTYLAMHSAELVSH